MARNINDFKRTGNVESLVLHSLLPTAVKVSHRSNINRLAVPPVNAFFGSMNVPRCSLAATHQPTSNLNPIHFHA